MGNQVDGPQALAAKPQGAVAYKQTGQKLPAVKADLADAYTAAPAPPKADGIADAVADAQAKQDGGGDNDPTPPKVEGEEELLAWLDEQRDANRRLTPDEVKKLRSKQRTEEIVSGISDAVRSLSNLYFTSQYAPNMYDHTKGMSEATKARWDKAWKEREAENDRYLNYALKGHAIRAQRAATQYQQARDKAQDDLKEREQTRKENWDAWQAQARQLELEIKQAQIAGNQKLAEEKIEELKRHNQAMEANGFLNATRPSGGGGGGGKPGEYPWYDKDGNLHYARSYEAMRQNAIQHGTWEEATQTSTTTRKGGSVFGTQTSTTTKPGKGHSSNPGQDKIHIGLLD